MNGSYLQKRKYASFILSLILHIILLLILIFATSIFKTDIKEINKDKQPARQSPATVSFNSKPAAQQVTPSAATPQQTITNPTIADQDQPTSFDTQAEEQSVPTPNTNTTPMPTQVSKDLDLQPDISPQATTEPAMPQEPIGKQEEATTEPRIPIIKDTYSRNNFGYNSTDTKPEPKPRQKRARTSKLAAAQFVNAFRASYRTSQLENRSAESNNNQDYKNTVHERVAEWKDAHYLQKIKNAIINASKMYSKNIYIPESIQKDMVMNILIDENGKLSDLKFEESTGLATLDEYLIDFLKFVDWPSIPQHLNLRIFHMPLKVRVTFPKGMGSRIICTL